MQIAYGYLVLIYFSVSTMGKQYCYYNQNIV